MFDDILKDEEVPDVYGKHWLVCSNCLEFDGEICMINGQIRVPEYMACPQYKEEVEGTVSASGAVR